MTFNPNIFDAYETNLIVDALEFFRENQSFRKDEWHKMFVTSQEIISKLKDD